MNKQTTLLLVSKNDETFKGIMPTLQNSHFTAIYADSLATALQKVGAQKVEVAVVAPEVKDATGLDCVKKIVTANPFINCALGSSLTSDDFHEVTEGYGVFMQLSEMPTASEAATMLEKLAKIHQLTA